MIAPLRCLCGQAAVSVAWAAQPAARKGAGAGGVEAGDIPISFAGSQSRGRADMQSGALDTTRVRSVVSQDELDPNAPQDVPLLALLSRTDKHGGAGGAFRVFRLGRELQLIKSWLHRANPDRYRLLQLRRERPHEWQALPTKQVPTRDTEIPFKMREMLQRGPGGALGEDGDLDGTRQQRKLRAWARSVLAKQQRLQTSDAFMMTTQDVVKEPLLEQEVEAFDCNALLERMFEQRRRLRPSSSRAAPSPDRATWRACSKWSSSRASTYPFAHRPKTTDRAAAAAAAAGATRRVRPTPRRPRLDSSSSARSRGRSSAQRPSRGRRPFGTSAAGSRSPHRTATGRRAR